MTYGENGHQLRSELTTLLRQHRIQQRLGGPGHPHGARVDHRRAARAARRADPALPLRDPGVVPARGRRREPAHRPRTDHREVTRAGRGAAIPTRAVHQGVECRPAAARRADHAAGVPDGGELAPGRPGRRTRRTRLRRPHGPRPTHARAVQDCPEGRRRGRESSRRPRQAIREHPRLDPHPRARPARPCRPGVRRLRRVRRARLLGGPQGLASSAGDDRRGPATRDRRSAAGRAQHARPPRAASRTRSTCAA